VTDSFLKGLTDQVPSIKALRIVGYLIPHVRYPLPLEAEIEGVDALLPGRLAPNQALELSGRDDHEPVARAHLFGELVFLSVQLVKKVPVVWYPEVAFLEAPERIVGFLQRPGLYKQRLSWVTGGLSALVSWSLRHCWSDRF